MGPVFFLIALAAAMPTTDLNEICQGAKVGALPEDRASAMRSCVDDEKVARDQLQQAWPHFSGKARQNCAETKGVAFSYVELLTCLKMQSGGDEFNKPRAPLATQSLAPAAVGQRP